MNNNRNCFRVNRLWLSAFVSLLVFVGANCSRNSSPGKDQLTMGNPVTDRIMNDEVHTYTAELEKGQFVNLSVEQRDVDVITKVG